MLDISSSALRKLKILTPVFLTTIASFNFITLLFIVANLSASNTSHRDSAVWHACANLIKSGGSAASTKDLLCFLCLWVVYLFTKKDEAQ